MTSQEGHGAGLMRDLPRSAAAVERAAGLAGPDAMVQAIRALAGGTHAATFLIQTANPELEVILREFPPGDDTAVREALVLAALDGLGGLAPRLLASGTDSVTADGSWVLISRLAGSADIAPADPSGWAGQLGRALARIHATSLRRLTRFQNVVDRPGASFASVTGPAAGQVAASWDRLASAPRRAHAL